MPRNSSNSHTTCGLCKQVRTLEFHHLIPRKVHRRNFFRKNFSKEELNRGVWICRLCHKGIHKTYSELDLAKNFNSLSRLATDPIIMRHVKWAEKQKVK